jgi:hypothetical protein
MIRSASLSHTMTTVALASLSVAFLAAAMRLPRQSLDAPR